MGPYNGHDPNQLVFTHENCIRKNLVTFDHVCYSIAIKSPPDCFTQCAIVSTWTLLTKDGLSFILALTTVTTDLLQN